MDVEIVNKQTEEIINKFFAVAELRPGNILVIGCSTSEIAGARIGTASSLEIAQAILEPILVACGRKKVFVAVQSCEHLNRCLVVERQLMERFGWEEVAVIPTASAGGALAATAMEKFREPVVVEEISAHAGIDIGATLIGMHLKKVAIPVRVEKPFIGKAPVTLAVTRPKLIGGPRASYGMIRDKQSS